MDRQERLIRHRVTGEQPVVKPLLRGVHSVAEDVYL